MMAYGQELEKNQTEMQLLISKYNSDLQRYSTLVQAASQSSNTITEAMRANATIAIQKATVASGHITATAQIKESHDMHGAALSSGVYQALSAQIQALQGQLGAVVAEIQSQ